MKSFTFAAALALLAVTVYGAPTSPMAERQFAAYITFEGATPQAQFTQSIPADGQPYAITNPLSISHIQSAGGATCVFTGIDGSKTTTVGAQTVDVGPPQTQVSAVCVAL